MIVLRQALINLDIEAGRWMSLKHPAYIRERVLTEGQGVSSKADWGRARRSGYRGVPDKSDLLDSDEGYLRGLFSNFAYALYAALRLADTIDFDRFSSVLELGCGEMFQAYLLKLIHPHLRYRATDFDRYVGSSRNRVGKLGG